VAGGERAVEHAGEIAEELRVKDVEFGEVDASELRVKPNLPVLGPKLGPLLRDIRAALQDGRFEALDGGRFRVDGHVLEPDEVLVEHVGKEGWAVAADNGLTVALDTALDDELVREGRVLDLIHEVNAMRREAGLALTDRIRLWIPTEDLLAYAERIEEDTLAVSIELGELRIEKA
jgi:isoleucyl-tRNA synthetase